MQHFPKMIAIFVERSKAMIRILLSARLGERRLNQAELSRMTGIRPSTINDLFNEIAVRVNLEHLDLICEALDCELSDLIVREKNTEITIKTKAGNGPYAKKK